MFTLMINTGLIVRAEDSINEGLAALAEGAYERAAATLADFVSKNPEHPAAPQAMCGSGQALAAMGRHAEALEFFEAALKRRSGRLREAPIQLACAKCAIAVGRFAHAAEYALQAIQSASNARETETSYLMLVSALCQDARCTEAWAELRKVAKSGDLAHSVLLAMARQVGADALTRGEATTASEAFSWQLENDKDTKGKQEAALGYAWAQSALATSPLEAAAALTEFVDQHPQASGASRALLAAARKQIEAQQYSGAIELLNRFAGDYSKSDEAADGLLLLIQVAEKTGDTALAQQMRGRLASQHMTSAAARDVLHIAIADAVAAGNDVLFESIVSTIFNSGDPQLVAQTLESLSETSGNEVVLRFADSGLQRMIDPTHHRVTAAIVDWLFEHEQWAVITEAAAKMPTDVLISDLHQGTVIAESLQRLGNTKAAYDLFSRLAATQAPTFVVMLRRAELAVQVGSLDEADQAISSASRSATSSRDRQYVQIVSAQLSIRRAEFDSARKTLDAVVLSPTADQRLRGRAQWLLGETYFMQRNYGAAIDAYRRCESMFPESGWSAAALLQAGKAFEKLGNFRDAAVCYTSLLNKHAKSPYARLASRRLGWIGNESNR